MSGQDVRKKQNVCIPVDQRKHTSSGRNSPNMHSNIAQQKMKRYDKKKKQQLGRTCYRNHFLNNLGVYNMHGENQIFKLNTAAVLFWHS